MWNGTSKSILTPIKHVKSNMYRTSVLVRQNVLFRFDSYEKMWKWTWIEHKIEHLNLKTATINLTHCNIPFFSTWVQNNSESSIEITQIVQINVNSLNSCAENTYFWPRDRFCVISDPLYNFIMEIWRNKFGFIADCIVEVQVSIFISEFCSFFLLRGETIVRNTTQWLNFVAGFGWYRD